MYLTDTQINNTFNFSLTPSHNSDGAINNRWEEQKSEQGLWDTHSSSVLIINSSFWQPTVDLCCPTDTCEIALQQCPVWFYYKFVLREIKFWITLYCAVKDVSKCYLCVCVCARVCACACMRTRAFSPLRVWSVCVTWCQFCSWAWAAERCFCCSSTLESNVQTWSNLQETYAFYKKILHWIERQMQWVHNIMCLSLSVKLYYILWCFYKILCTTEFNSVFCFNESSVQMKHECKICL